MLEEMTQRAIEVNRGAREPVAPTAASPDGSRNGKDGGQGQEAPRSRSRLLEGESTSADASDNGGRRMETRDETSAGGVVFRPRRRRLRRRDHPDARGPLAVAEGLGRGRRGARGDGGARSAGGGGLDAEVVGPIGTIEYWFVSHYDPEPARIHKRVHFFLLRYIGGSTDDHDDEVQDARWVEIGEALRLLAFDGERRVMATAQKALEGVAKEAGDA